MNRKIDTIIAAATQNGIPLNKNFNVTFLSTHGFFEGPQRLAEKTITDMERLCFLGLNAGFDNQLKSAIDKLSDVVCNLTNVKNGDVRELSKMDAQCMKILENVRESAYPVRVDARSGLNDYISSSAEAIDTIISLHKDGEIFSTVDARQIEYLEASKEKLGEIALGLACVLDVGSNAAGENAQKVIDLIRKWREDAARFMCTGRSLKYLDDAKAIVQNWAKVTVAPGKKDKLSEAPKYVRDEMSVIADSRGGLETLSVFNARIQTRLAEVEKMREELNADKAKVSELKGKLAELEKKKRDIAIEFKNTGDAVKANRAIAEVRQEAESIESEIKSLEGNGRLARKEKDIKNRREIALHIKHICDTLTDNKSDLVFLAKVIQHVDFNALVGVMTGRNADMDEARESILQIRVRVDNLRQSFMEGARALDDEDEITTSILEEDYVDEFVEEKVETVNGLDKELADLLKEVGEEKPEEEKVEEDGVRRIVPLGDDDK
ncbi:MAG: hypothetical protein K2N30_03835 [Clostridia bacterium]|nr:hypothetical protein [Clostridia bacterium]